MDAEDAERLLAQGKTGAITADEADEANEVATLFKAWVDEAQAMISLSHQGKPEEAIALFHKKADP